MPNTPANAFTAINQVSDLDAVVSLKPGAREEILLASQGWQSWSYDLFAGGVTSTAETSQTIHASAVALNGGNWVSSLLLAVDTAASGTALANNPIFGFTNQAGVVQAVSSATFTATTAFPVGVNTYALSAPWQVPGNGLYYAFMWINGTFGTTQPKFRNTYATAVLTAGQTLYGNLGTSITTAPAVGTALTFSAAAGPAFWVAVQ